MIKKLRQLKDLAGFLGPYVNRRLQFAIALGALWFIIESSLILVMQAFLISLGMMPQPSTPSWIPSSKPLIAFGGLIAYGGLRALIHYLKILNSDSAQCIFIRNQKTRLMRYGLFHAGSIDEHKLVDLFNERTAKAGEYVRLLFSFIDTSLNIILLTLLAGWIAPIELVIGMVVLILITIPFNKLHKTFSKYGRQLINTSTETTLYLINGIRNNFLLKIYSQLESETAKGVRVIEDYSDVLLRYQLLSGVRQVVPSFLATLVLCLLAVVSTRLLNTSPEVFLAFCYLFLRISQNLSYANNAVSSLRLTAPSFKSVKDAFRSQIANSPDANQGDSNINCENITLRAQNIALKFKDSDKIFSNICFEVKDGDSLLIKGPSGSGKSSLLAIIAGLIRPSSGFMTLNDINAADCRKEIARIFGYVGTSTVLISGTIRDNLLYAHQGNPYPHDSELLRCLALAKLDHLIHRWPKSLDTPISENYGFSTGERQRLAIARGLARRPKILIFDEATANLDRETESELINEILNLPYRVIKIFVTHRSSLDNIGATQVRL